VTKGDLMSIVFFNSSISNQETAWSMSNGATRRVLKIINKTGKELEANKPHKVSLGFLDKGNHSFIFVNPENKKDDKSLAVFMNGSYGYQTDTKPIFENYSSGGYGNSCSQFGIYNINTLFSINSYKNRTGKGYIKFTEKGFESLKEEDIIKEEEITTV
jgi:hypothetical protein